MPIFPTQYQKIELVDYMTTVNEKVETKENSAIWGVISLVIAIVALSFAPILTRITENELVWNDI